MSTFLWIKLHVVRKTRGMKIWLGKILKIGWTKTLKLYYSKLMEPATKALYYLGNYVWNIPQWLFDGILCHIPLEARQVSTKFHWNKIK